MKGKHVGVRLVRCSNSWNSCHRPNLPSADAKPPEGHHLVTRGKGQNRITLLPVFSFFTTAIWGIWCKGRSPATTTGAKSVRTRRELPDTLLGPSLWFYQQGGKSSERWGHLPKVPLDAAADLQPQSSLLLTFQVLRTAQSRYRATQAVQYGVRSPALRPWAHQVSLSIERGKT